MRLTVRLFSLFICFICALPLAAQTPAPTPPPFTPMVWDIDWSRVQPGQAGTDWSDRLRFLPPGRDAAHATVVTGQARVRGEYQDHPGFGAQPADNGYLLQRYLISADTHISPWARLFLQLGSSLEEGRDGGPRPGIDRDRLDFNQGFLDITPWQRGADAVTIRTGRQLVSLGSTRLVAIGAGLNVEQPFDGVRILAHAFGWTADALALRPTSIQSGVLDNAPNSAEELWGLSVSHPLHALHTNGDLYYLGFDHRQARYTSGIGREQRETLGMRLWERRPSWEYDIEATEQFGRFGRGDIRAWAIGYHGSYALAHHRFAPRPEIDGGVLSGDHTPHNSTLGTFNPLFPNGSYLGESILLGPSNLILTRPTLKLALTRQLASNTNEEFLWREATEDGIYNIVGILIHPAAGSARRYVGSQFQQQFTYAATRHLSLGLTYEHFFAGGFLKQSPPARSVNFISPQITWNF